MSRRVFRGLLAVTAAAVALSLGACAENSADRAATPPPTPSAGGAAAFPVTVGQVTLEKRPEKIVSLSPSVTESLFAIGAGKQVVAADSNSNYPADAPKTELSGFKPNAEAIAGYQPDLVILSNDLENIGQSLTTLKIKFFLAPAATSLDDVYAQINDLGKLTGHATEASDLTTRMKDDITKLIKDLPKREQQPTYYYELDPNLYSVTSKTFIGSLFSLVGLANIADPADTSGDGYPQLSAEALVGADPDLIFLADSKCCQQNAETVKARAGWSGVTAVRTGQIYPLDDDIASRWGPRVVDLIRSIVDAVTQASR
jgi:iron complex transport system substrate-binding protein